MSPRIFNLFLEHIMQETLDDSANTAKNNDVVTNLRLTDAIDLMGGTGKVNSRRLENRVWSYDLEMSRGNAGMARLKLTITYGKPAQFSQQLNNQTIPEPRTLTHMCKIWILRRETELAEATNICNEMPSVKISYMYRSMMTQMIDVLQAIGDLTGPEQLI